MQDFDLSSHLDNIYATFPQANHRPVIGLTANYTSPDASLRDFYYRQVVRAGGVPIIIPPVADKNVIINTLDSLDGIILTGGADYNPLWAGEEPSERLESARCHGDAPLLWRS